MMNNKKLKLYKINIILIGWYPNTELVEVLTGVKGLKDVLLGGQIVRFRAKCISNILVLVGFACFVLFLKPPEKGVALYFNK